MVSCFLSFSLNLVHGLVERQQCPNGVNDEDFEVFIFGPFGELTTPNKVYFLWVFQQRTTLLAVERRKQKTKHQTAKHRKREKHDFGLLLSFGQVIPSERKNSLIVFLQRNW